MDPSLIQTLAVAALPVLFAITLHEAAHGFVARHFGDQTAWVLGRVSLNPVRHIDPIGTVLMPILLYFATGGSFLFGYAKPVPVNFGRLRNPRWHSLWVALAGPAANFVMAFGWIVVLLLLQRFDVDEAFWLKMAGVGVRVNLVMCALNLFPVPPLDGGRILAALLPTRPSLALSRLEPFGFYIVMALVVFGVLPGLWLLPVMDLLETLLRLLLLPLTLLLS